MSGWPSVRIKIAGGAPAPAPVPAETPTSAPTRSDRSDARRPRRAEVDIGEGVRMVPGGSVELLNISETGALVESKERLPVGTGVVLAVGGAQPKRLEGRIVRSSVSAIHRDSTMTYQLGIAFEAETRFDGIPPAPPSGPPAVSAESPGPSAQPAELENEW